MPSDKTVSHDAGGQAGIEQALEEIERCLQAEDWSAAETRIGQLPALIESLPVAARAALLPTLAACLAAFRVRIETQSATVGAQLNTVRQGRIATRTYTDTGRSSV